MAKWTLPAKTRWEVTRRLAHALLDVCHPVEALFLSVALEARPLCIKNIDLKGCWTFFLVTRDWQPGGEDGETCARLTLTR